MHWERFGQLTAIMIALQAARITGETLLGISALMLLMLAGRFTNAFRSDGRRRHMALVRALSADSVIQTWGDSHGDRRGSHAASGLARSGILSAHGASEIFEYRRTATA